MNRRKTTLLACVALLALLAPSASPAAAQEASPVAASPGLTLAAGGLVEPTGMAWSPDGTLHVAEANAVGPAGHAATPAASGSLDGAIVRVPDGCPVVVQGNLPSSGSPDGSDIGPAAIAFLDGQLYLLDEGGGISRGNPLTPDGIYRISGDGSAPLVADIGAWVSANPVGNPAADAAPDGDVSGMAVAGGAFVVVESAQRQVLRVTSAGEITRLADLSGEAEAPRGIAVTPGGEVLVGLGSRIVAIAEGGTAEDAWTGLTGVIEVAVDQTGTVYALQADGTVLRQTADGARVVATGFGQPAAMAFGPDGDLYVSTSPAGHPAAGGIVRIDTDWGQAMTMHDSLLTGSTCIAQPTPTSVPTQPATPDSAPADGTPSGGGGNGVTVDIAGFAFSETTLTVEAGTTVTWVNRDAASHTVTARDNSFDSGAIPPGGTFTHTFPESGSFAYICSFHPQMEATVVVD